MGDTRLSGSLPAGRPATHSLVMKLMNSDTHSCTVSFASFAIFAFDGRARFIIRLRVTGDTPKARQGGPHCAAKARVQLATLYGVSRSKYQLATAPSAGTDLMLATGKKRSCSRPPASSSPPAPSLMMYPICLCNRKGCDTYRSERFFVANLFSLADYRTSFCIAMAPSCAVCSCSSQLGRTTLSCSTCVNSRCATSIQYYRARRRLFFNA